MLQMKYCEPGANHVNAGEPNAPPRSARPQVDREVVANSILLNQKAAHTGSGGLSSARFRLELKQVTRLAMQNLANRLERRKADRARLSRFENRQIGERDVDPLREFRQGHPPIVEKI